LITILIRSSITVCISALEYASFVDLMTSYERLKGKASYPRSASIRGLTMSINYKDPESNSVELQSDNFGDWHVL
jgi:hypothetical protein